MLFDFLAGRHRRHRLHADHQRAGSGDSRGVPLRDEAGVERRRIRAAPDAAAVAELRPPRHRRRRRRALHRLPRPGSRRPAAVAAVTAPMEVRVPDIGGSKNVDVIELLAKPGESIGKDQGLLTLESDKATMEVPSPAAGVLKEWKVKVGDSVAEGQLLAILEAEDVASAPKAEAQQEAPKPAAASGTAPAKTAPAPAAPAPQPASADGRKADIECQLVVLG